MKKFLVFPVLLFSLFLAGQVEKAIPQRPSPPRLVNDFTGTLTPEQAQALESKVVAWDDSTSNQLAIVLVNSLSDYDPDEYALALGRQWGVGGKDHNNGIVLLVAKNDHKISIQVGYGLEGA